MYLINDYKKPEENYIVLRFDMRRIPVVRFTVTICLFSLDLENYNPIDIHYNVSRSEDYFKEDSYRPLVNEENINEAILHIKRYKIEIKNNDYGIKLLSKEKAKETIEYFNFLMGWTGRWVNDLEFVIPSNHVFYLLKESRLLEN